MTSVVVFGSNHEAKRVYIPRLIFDSMKKENRFRILSLRLIL